MQKTNLEDEVTATQFKRLVFDLWEHSPGTRVRFRTLGKLWDTHFLQIVHVTASDAVIVQEGEQLRYVHIKDILQFELETQFREFKPNFHYKVQFGDHV